ncbi:hypothetical protein [Streptomyces sp. SP18BB07]|uniref:hypothetical protein n=1 Tax=Streptomyces sp. SP18BB07 TaxID=3002522 RepID=UPI002E75B392|nr:hypothetical protein [Streptomyces sp. SP18BB07]MEE1763536.1 hypothetical protein [Streptomyces sp. SP18BB07]
MVFTQEDGSWLHPGKVTDLFERLVAASGLAGHPAERPQVGKNAAEATAKLVPLQRKTEAEEARKAAKKAKDNAKAEARAKRKGKAEEAQEVGHRTAPLTHCKPSRGTLARVTQHVPSNTKAQVTDYVTWAFSEPPSGFEPETYALRDHERSCCLVPRGATW